MSLRTRITLLVGVTVLLASAIGGIGTVVSSSSVGRNRVDQALLADAGAFDTRENRLAGQLQFAFDVRSAACDEATPTETTAAALGLDENPTNRTPGRREGRLRFLPEFSSSLQLLRSDGTAIAACQMLPVDTSDQAIANEGTGSQFRSVTIDGERFRVLTRGYNEIGAIQFARNLEITDDTLRGLLARSFGFGLFGALIASALGWVFATRATAPVRRLSETAERVAQTQDLGERIDVESPDEIGAMAESFNTMLSSLDTSREQQNRLVQDASHELRTPLTSIRTNVELLQRHPTMDPAVREEVLSDIGAELNELTELTGELVDSATQVPASISLNEAVDLVSLATACAEKAERRYRRNVTISALAPADAANPILGDASLLTRAITNLVNNAVKFTTDDIEVIVSASSVLVVDRGPGIPTDDIEHIFDRFYRATAARSAPGSGLGLSIVKQIVEGHGGSVNAANREGGGAAIGFSLPAAASTHIDRTPRLS